MSTIVFRPGGPFSGPRFTLIAGSALLLLGVADLVGGSRVTGPGFTLLGLWYATMSRQHAVLTDHDLVVQGRLTLRTVDLADVEQVHALPSRLGTAWLAARGQRPFRVYFLAPGDPGPTRPGTTVFVTEVRRRAAAAGASVDVDGELHAPNPPGTSPLFGL